MEVTDKVLSIEEVEKTLESVFVDQNVKNPKIDIEAGSVKGDGYMSFITKVDVTSDNKDLHLMIKVAPKLESLRKMVPIRNIFLREIYFYDTIIKEFENFRIEKGLCEELMSVPKCLKTVQDEGNEMLIMENIKLQGFRMWNRKIQMNQEHIDMVFKQYAKFHAISYAMKDQNPDLFNSLADNLQQVFTSETMSPEMYNKFIENNKNSCAFLNTETDKKVFQSIEKYQEGLIEFFLMMEKNKGEHPVIIHGDCWCNNMMFKYEKDEMMKPKSMCFLDFQLCVLASPMRDLCYFFHVSAPKDILYNYKHHLNIYYKELKEQYLKLGGSLDNLLSFNDLLNEWKIYAKYGFTMSLFLFKVMLCDEDEAMDFVEVSEQNMHVMDFFNRKLNKDDTTKEMIKTLATYMCDNDFF